MSKSVEVRSRALTSAVPSTQVLLRCRWQRLRLGARARGRGRRGPTAAARFAGTRRAVGPGPGGHNQTRVAAVQGRRAAPAPATAPAPRRQRQRRNAGVERRGVHDGRRGQRGQRRRRRRGAVLRLVLLLPVKARLQGRRAPRVLSRSRARRQGRGAHVCVTSCCGEGSQTPRRATQKQHLLRLG